MIKLDDLNGVEDLFLGTALELGLSFIPDFVIVDAPKSAVALAS